MIGVARLMGRDRARAVMALDSRGAPDLARMAVYEERQDLGERARRNDAQLRHLESAFRSLGVSEGRGLGTAMAHRRMAERPDIVGAKRR